MGRFFNSGFAFLAEPLPGILILENKFTGLRIRVNERTGEYNIMED